MTTHRQVALLRGINVGTAKRIAMADLRALFTGLGYTAVRTHLQSGNVVFDAPTVVDAAAVALLESEILQRTSVQSRILVIPSDRFRKIADNNPLADSPDPSRMVVTFMNESPLKLDISQPNDDELAPERLVIGADAIYQWCPDGILKSKLPATFFSKLGTLTTSRNLRTVTKLVQMLEE